MYWEHSERRPFEEGDILLELRAHGVCEKTSLGESFLHRVSRRGEGLVNSSSLLHDEIGKLKKNLRSKA